MFEIRKTFRFSASHVLMGLPEGHPCGRLHGHNYGVELVLRGRTGPTGFIRDYRDLDAFRDHLDTHYDHRHLNLLIAQPTAELLAEQLYGWAVTRWPEVVACRVSETESTWAEFRPDDAEGGPRSGLGVAWEAEFGKPIGGPGPAAGMAQAPAGGPPSGGGLAPPNGPAAPGRRVRAAEGQSGRPVPSEASPGVRPVDVFESDRASAWHGPAEVSSDVRPFGPIIEPGGGPDAFQGLRAEQAIEAVVEAARRGLLVGRPVMEVGAYHEAERRRQAVAAAASLPRTTGTSDDPSEAEDPAEGRGGVWDDEAADPVADLARQSESGRAWDRHRRPAREAEGAEPTADPRLTNDPRIATGFGGTRGR